MLRFIFIFFQLLTIAWSEQRIDICRSDNDRCIGFTCDQLREYKADFEDKYCKFESRCKIVCLLCYSYATLATQLNKHCRYDAQTLMRLMFCRLFIDLRQTYKNINFAIKRSDLYKADFEDKTSIVNLSVVVKFIFVLIVVMQNLNR